MKLHLTKLHWQWHGHYITWQALGLLCVVLECNLYVSALELFLCGDAKESSRKLLESINSVHRYLFVRKLSFGYRAAFTLIYATVPNATLHLKKSLLTGVYAQWLLYMEFLSLQDLFFPGRQTLGNLYSSVNVYFVDGLGWHDSMRRFWQVLSRTAHCFLLFPFLCQSQLLLKYMPLSYLSSM